MLFGVAFCISRTAKTDKGCDEDDLREGGSFSAHLATKDRRLTIVLSVVFWLGLGGVVMV